ncbi:MAG: nucleoside deaminase [Pseudomonadota bacterium]|nr:nucleoside deaminase [Pseudomonadota bacterium]
MELAIKEAKKAALRDEIPIGAIIKEDSGKVIAKESNKIIELCDPTAHAEINAIRIACTVREDLYLSDCTMYVTLEPCSMCLGAIINSRLKKLVYGLPSPKYGAFSSNHSTLKNTEGLIKNTEVYGGFYQSEISLIMREFFEDKRTRFDGNRH